MKILQSSFLLIGLALCLWACQSEEPEPAPSPGPSKRLKKITWNDGATSEYTYDAQGKLLERYDQGAQLAFAYRYGFEYDAQGRLVSSHLNSLVFYAYAYDATGKLRQAKETDHQGKWTYQHHFEYNAKAQLTTVRSEVPLEAGKFRPDKKLVFAYDPQGNLEKITSYQFDEAEEAFYPLQFVIYEDYDGQKKVEYFTSISPFVPTLDLQKSNPRKVTYFDASSLLPPMVEEHEYKYDANGYPVTRKIRVSGRANLSIGSDFFY